jgi:hypothetical protein
LRISARTLVLEAVPRIEDEDEDEDEHEDEGNFSKLRALPALARIGLRPVFKRKGRG